jgi:cation transporter-like permease
MGQRSVGIMSAINPSINRMQVMRLMKFCLVLTLASDVFEYAAGLTFNQTK